MMVLKNPRLAAGNGPAVDGDRAGSRAGQTCRRVRITAVRVVHIGDLELQSGGWNWQPDPDQTFREQQTIGISLGGRGRDVVGRTGGAIEQPEQRVIEIRIKALARMLRTDRPRILGLVTGKASAPVSSEVLEKSVLRRQCRTVWLEGRDDPARIRIYLQLRDYGRCRLSARRRIREQPAHFLGVSGRACPRRSGGAIGY
jgi:hypothetical protein